MHVQNGNPRPVPQSLSRQELASWVEILNQTSPINSVNPPGCLEGHHGADGQAEHLMLLQVLLCKQLQPGISQLFPRQAQRVPACSRTSDCW